MASSTVDFETAAPWRETRSPSAVPPPDEMERKRRAFESEALPHLDSLYRVALGYAGDRARAEDWVQETMLRAYRSWHRYQPGTNIRAWLLTILRHTFFKEYGSARRIESVDFGAIEQVAAFEGIQESDPEGRFFREIVDAEVLRAIDRLPGEFRETLLLSDVEDLPQAEIAHLTGVPLGTVKSRLHRARRLLQRRLHRYAEEMGYLRTPTPAAR